MRVITVLIATCLNNSSRSSHPGSHRWIRIIVLRAAPRRSSSSPVAPVTQFFFRNYFPTQQYSSHQGGREVLKQHDGESQNTADHRTCRICERRQQHSVGPPCRAVRVSSNACCNLGLESLSYVRYAKPQLGHLVIVVMTSNKLAGIIVTVAPVRCAWPLNSKSKLFGAQHKQEVVWHHGSRSQTSCRSVSAKIV